MQCSSASVVIVQSTFAPLSTSALCLIKAVPIIMFYPFLNLIKLQYFIGLTFHENINGRVMLILRSIPFFLGMGQKGVGYLNKVKRLILDHARKSVVLTFNVFFFDRTTSIFLYWCVGLHRVHLLPNKDG